jgi:transcription initiation factor TFIIIB Brf1 subunit/transcription initiation factor TFIIB
VTARISPALFPIRERAAAIIMKLFDDGKLSGAQVCRRCGAVVDPDYTGVHAEWHAHRSWPVTSEDMMKSWAD